jgi:hypothetical protein
MTNLEERDDNLDLKYLRATFPNRLEVRGRGR